MSNTSAVILGVNFGGHDTSAALMIDGFLVAAAEEERYDLRKHSRAFPNQAIADCLRIAGITIDEVARQIKRGKQLGQAKKEPKQDPKQPKSGD